MRTCYLRTRPKDTLLNKVADAFLWQLGTSEDVYLEPTVQPKDKDGAVNQLTITIDQTQASEMAEDQDSDPQLVETKKYLVKGCKVMSKHMCQGRCGCQQHWYELCVEQWVSREMFPMGGIMPLPDGNGAVDSCVATLPELLVLFKDRPYLVVGAGSRFPN